jgi:membrane protein implicated in regulation of membrane protease activity
MEWLLDEPSVVLVCVTIAAALLIVEVALPTVGIAGTLALIAGGVAVAGIVHQDATWWPLLGPAFAVGTWAVMIARQRRSTVGEVLAATAFALGGAGFAIANDDTMSMVVTVIATPLLAWGFPRLHDAATRLAQRPALTGMEALVGHAASVDRWDRTTGVVMIDGSRWNAAATQDLDLAPGDPVTVVGFHGMTVEVWPPPGPPGRSRS